MASGKRASMREGPLAALFRRTDDDEQLTPEPAPAPETPAAQAAAPETPAPQAAAPAPIEPAPAPEPKRLPSPDPLFD